MYTQILSAFILFLVTPLVVGAEDRPSIYPFDVTVGGQEAVFRDRFPIFAKVPKPVASDAEVVLGADPEAVIVNVFPCNARGVVTLGVQAKVIMVGRGSSFKLNQTMDKSVLAPGIYGMNIVLRSKGTARVMFVVGDAAVAGAPAPPTPAPATAEVDQSTPEKALEAVFAAAKSGDLASLKALVPASGDLDGDVERIRDVSEADEAAQKEFKEWFATGKVVGAARIEGTKAEVDFTFGPKGTRDETMNLVSIDGTWFLDSF